MSNIEDQIKGETEEFRKQIENRMEGLRAKITELSEKMKEGKKVEEDEINNLKTAVEAIAKDVEDKAKIKDVSDLRVNIKKLSEELNRSIENQERSIRDAKELISMLKEDMKRVAKQIEGKKEEYGDLMSKIDEINSQISKLSEKLESGQSIENSELIRLRGDVNVLSDKVDERARKKEISEDVVNMVVNQFKKNVDISEIIKKLKEEEYSRGQINERLEKARLKWIYG